MTDQPQIPQLSERSVIVIDNYDSFTYNLVQYLQQMRLNVNVLRNDSQSTQTILDLKPDAIILSPGPSDPDHAGVCLELVREAADKKVPLLGVCLGHQTIGQCFGGAIKRHEPPMHGKTCEIHHNGEGVFAGLPSPFTATRYHSLVVAPESLPECLEVTAQSADGVIQGLKHKNLPVEGVQFHPESILTQHGHRLLANFIESYT